MEHKESTSFSLADGAGIEEDSPLEIGGTIGVRVGSASGFTDGVGETEDD
jgi:hypothetical protein